MLETAVRRVVYLSTTEVYGDTPPDIVDETTEPTTPTANSYARSKLAAEQLCLEYSRARALPVVILRLALVYGPHSPIATVAVVERLLNRGFCASELFDGLCNPVFVDDCVDAISRASTRDNVIGETFIINGGETLTWNAYLREVQSAARAASPAAGDPGTASPLLARQKGVRPRHAPPATPVRS